MPDVITLFAYLCSLGVLGLALWTCWGLIRGTSHHLDKLNDDWLNDTERVHDLRGLHDQWDVRHRR